MSGDARDFNNIGSQAVTKVFFLQGNARKEVRAILTETIACFRPGRAKDLPAPLYTYTHQITWHLRTRRLYICSYAV